MRAQPGERLDECRAQQRVSDADVLIATEQGEARSPDEEIAPFSQPADAGTPAEWLARAVLDPAATNVGACVRLEPRKVHVDSRRQHESSRPTRGDCEGHPAHVAELGALTSGEDRR